LKVTDSKLIQVEGYGINITYVNNNKLNLKTESYRFEGNTMMYMAIDKTGRKLDKHGKVIDMPVTYSVDKNMTEFLKLAYGTN